MNVKETAAYPTSTGLKILWRPNLNRRNHNDTTCHVADKICQKLPLQSNCHPGFGLRKIAESLKTIHTPESAPTL